MIARRDVVFGAAALAAAAAAEALTPRRAWALLGTTRLAALVPARFDGWTRGGDEGVLLADTRGLAEELYDDQLACAYRHVDGAQVMLLIAHGSEQSERLQLHRPELCYPAFGFTIASDVPARVPIAPGIAVPARRLRATAFDREERIIYWTRIGPYLPVTAHEQTRDRLRLAMRGLIGDGVIVRASIAGGDDAGAFARLDRFLGAMVTAIAPANRPALIGGAGGAVSPA